MYKRLLLVLAGFSLLAGCGGGGGGGSETGLPSAYTGKTTQAVVTTTNARTLSSEAYSGCQMVSTFDVLGKAVTDSNSQSPLLQSLVSLLDSTVSTVIQEPKTLTKSVQAASTLQNTILGYTGSYTYTISIDPVSGASSGTLSFSQYNPSNRNGSVTMTGFINFSGVYNQSISNFSSLNMSLNNIVVTSSSGNVKISGSFAASIDGSTKTYSMTVAITDNVSNNTILLKDYTLKFNGGSFVFTGTYYNPTHGYVVISTDIPLTVYSLSGMPTSGQLLFTGSNGTKARLSFGGRNPYTVTADTVGNGMYVEIL